MQKVILWKKTVINRYKISFSIVILYDKILQGKKIIILRSLLFFSKGISQVYEVGNYIDNLSGNICYNGKGEWSYKSKRNNNGDTLMKVIVNGKEIDSDSYAPDMNQFHVINHFIGGEMRAEW